MTQEAFLTNVYQENATFLLLLCKKRVGYNRAYQELIEDCIQDTFVIATKKYELLLEHPNVRAWLVQTCMNLLLPRLKREQTKMQLTAFSLDDTKKAYEPQINYIEAYLHAAICREILLEVKNDLTPKEQMISYRYFLEKQSMREIADAFSISENAVKGTIKKVRRKAKAKKIKENF